MTVFGYLIFTSKRYLLSFLLYLVLTMKIERIEGLVSGHPKDAKLSFPQLNVLNRKNSYSSAISTSTTLTFRMPQHTSSVICSWTSLLQSAIWGAGMAQW